MVTFGGGVWVVASGVVEFGFSLGVYVFRFSHRFF